MRLNKQLKDEPLSLPPSLSLSLSLCLFLSLSLSHPWKMHITSWTDEASGFLKIWCLGRAVVSQWMWFGLLLYYYSLISAVSQRTLHLARGLVGSPETCGDSVEMLVIGMTVEVECKCPLWLTPAAL